MEAKKIYYDKSKNEIKANMILRHDDETLHKVYASANNDDELGFNAANHNFTGNAYEEIRSLSEFNLNEYELVGCAEVLSVRKLVQNYTMLQEK